MRGSALTCAAFRPPSPLAAAHAVRREAQAAMIPQDITSSCTEVSEPDGNDFSASFAKKKKKLFFWFFLQLFTKEFVVGFCHPAVLVFVFIHNRLPDGRRRERERKKGSSGCFVW